MVLNRTDLKSIFLLGRQMSSFTFSMDVITREMIEGLPFKETRLGQSLLNLDLEGLKQGVEKLGDTKTAEDIDKLLKKLNRTYKKEETLKEADAKEIFQKVLVWQEHIGNLLTEKVSIEQSPSTILD